MKILMFTDNHFSETSSIISKHGNKYSIRLENQLKSINWLERIAEEQKCDLVVCLGDFFNKPALNDDEITAVNDIEWSNIQHYFIVGNHESEERTLQCSSTMILKDTNREIIYEPCKKLHDNVELCMLPYIIESDRKKLAEYFGQREKQIRVILSHNDIKGIQMGPAVSQTGFEIEDIDSNCDLFINGHLHNGQPVSKKALNLGNLTGKDFGEDATRYKHQVLILDTDKMSCTFIENPHAFNFYKIEVLNEQDLDKFDNIKNNSALSITCKDSLISKLQQKLNSLADKIIAQRIIRAKVFADSSDVEIDISDLTVDHIARFCECCREKIENTPILEAELAEICK